MTKVQEYALKRLAGSTALEASQAAGYGVSAWTAGEALYRDAKRLALEAEPEYFIEVLNETKALYEECKRMERAYVVCQLAGLL